MRKQNPRREYTESIRAEREEQEAGYRQKMEKRERARSFLPDPEVLENYNYVVEGSAARILAMVEMEQKHRQQFELNQQKMVAMSTFAGSVSLVAIFCIMFGTTSDLIREGKGEYAILTAVIASVFIFLAIISSFKRSFSKKEFNKNRRIVIDSEQK